MSNLLQFFNQSRINGCPEYSIIPAFSLPGMELRHCGWLSHSLREAGIAATCRYDNWILLDGIMPTGAGGHIGRDELAGGFFALRQMPME